MKNKEKYTNTEEALKVFNTQRKMVESVKDHAPTLTFEEWLDAETFEDVLKDIMHMAEELFNSSQTTENTICPICGGKNITVSSMLFTSLRCKDCGAVVLFDEHGEPRKESKDNFVRRLANKGKL
jgi:DNA phosphorothioation-dependent restriction protein DptG